MDLLPSLDIQCPYCGEYQSISIEVSAGDQRYIEDCQICCRPMSIAADVDEDGVASVRVHGADEA
ncbi:CPXCG motif-containing cysteine-rich protein [Pseudoxanthomonas dokdonensis]|uniref:LITAF-like zinc ribbon domain containing protein n=1 Tax=Pseudoxanthomonas dokdonensis TaxID=344882 RepID=A0A0R0CKB5_9GAMM|nr:CPXCG motif-containing cysteine-rich protein [Pseudoxanthomonas dokdonensis]KRG69984.1 hypothetical protein ABB29_07000 [Pseudoxanthomonas dokdonensis]